MRRLAGIAGATILVFTGAALAPAQGSDSTRTIVERTVSVARNGYSAVTVTCPSSLRLLSGGFDVRQARVETSAPVSDVEWVVVAAGLDAPAPPNGSEPPAIDSHTEPYVTAIAICG